jgi:uncharacterized membrane protein
MIVTVGIKEVLGIPFFATPHTGSRKTWLSFLVFFCIASMSLFAFDVARAQELVESEQIVAKSVVLEVISQERKNIPGLDTKTDYQKIRVKILEGIEEGKEVVVENDYLNLEKGDVFYLAHTTNSVDGTDQYAVLDPYRLPAILFFVGLFILCVVLFGGIQGIRGLLSLIGSLLLIIYLLLPAVLHGYSPIAVTIATSSLIIILGSYITHGFNKTTTAAVFGMIVTVIITGLLAYFAVKYTRLSGFESEESVYLNLNTNGLIDFSGLLLSGIMIGLLGILYDVGIGQAVSVEELYKIGPHLPKSVIYKRALRIGREHIGALVNTLAIAYVGASLPLLLLFYSYKMNILLVLNKEVFAAEIIRAMIGSIGLVLAVPISTFIAVFMLVKHKNQAHDKSVLDKERKEIEHFDHHV